MFEARRDSAFGVGTLGRAARHCESGVTGRSQIQENQGRNFARNDVGREPKRNRPFHAETAEATAAVIPWAGEPDSCIFFNIYCE